MGLALREGIFIFVNMDDLPKCYGHLRSHKEVCRVCYISAQCYGEIVEGVGQSKKVRITNPVKGVLDTKDFHLGYTLASGQVFRWGRDIDGWWKGIAFGTVFHLQQDGNQLRFRASAEKVEKFSEKISIVNFLRWYLRLEEPPNLRVPRGDLYLRQARDSLRGFRFIRQEPFECTISYVLSVQAHMTLTKRRINFLARILGSEIEFMGERYWDFPKPNSLAQLNGLYFRYHRFGWRSDRVVASARQIEATKVVDGIKDWQVVIDRLRSIPGNGVGLKVAKCIDLFSLERLQAVPVDTWVRKFAKEWYGICGSDSKICAWGEARGGKWAGYVNEYLFAYYREQNGSSIYDRVMSFCESDIPSAELPFLT